MIFYYTHKTVPGPVSIRVASSGSRLDWVRRSIVRNVEKSIHCSPSLKYMEHHGRGEEKIVRVRGDGRHPENMAI